MINKTILQGRLTREPELKKTQNDVNVCNFSVAWSKKIKDGEITVFVDCTAWRYTAEFISKYFTKGQQIVLEGELRNNNWTEESGNKHSKLYLEVSEVHFSGNKNTDSVPEGIDEKTGEVTSDDFFDLNAEEDLPF